MAGDITGQLLTGLSDAGLREALCQRREDALAEAYARHGASVFRLASWFCGPTEAEPVLHQAFLSLWRTPTDFDPNRQTMETWLLSQAHRHAVATVREDPGQRRHPHSVVAQMQQHLAADPSKDDQTTVWDLLRTLPDQQGQAIALSYFGGYRCDQVATMMRGSEQSVASHIRTGLLQLHSVIGNQGAASGLDP